MDSRRVDDMEGVLQHIAAAQAADLRKPRMSLKELERRVKAGDPEAIDLAIRIVNSVGKAMATWLESIRPSLEKIMKVMNTPEVRAWFEQEERKQ